MPESKEAPAEIEKKAKLLVIGAFKPGEVIVEKTGNQLAKTPEIEELIKNGWKGKEHLVSEPLVRLQSYDLHSYGLKLITGETTYKEYLGTRDLKTLRRLGYKNIANPISTSAALITKDNKLVIARKLRGDASGSVDAIGGYINRNWDVNENGQIDVFKAAKREIKEETGISPEELENMLCLSLTYEYGETCHPTLSFIARVNKSSQQLNGKGADGEIKTIIVDAKQTEDTDDIEYVMNVLQKAYPDVEPDGRVTLALARKWLQGKNYPERIYRTIENI